MKGFEALELFRRAGELDDRSPHSADALFKAVLDFILPLALVLWTVEWVGSAGLPFVGSMAVTLAYAGYCIRRAIRRGQQRNALPVPRDVEEDAREEPLISPEVEAAEASVEASRDFAFDFIVAAVLLILAWLWWPTARYLLEHGETLLGTAIALGSGFVGVGGLASLWEGGARLRRYIGGLRVLQEDLEAARNDGRLLSSGSETTPDPPAQLPR